MIVEKDAYEINFIDKFNKLFNYLIILLPIYYIISFLLVAVSRMNYPFDLEWMEGTMLIHVLRINDGLSIYSAPSINFIPFIYTPVYFYFSSFITQIFSADYFALRFVSFLSTVLIIIFIYLIVSKETSSKRMGLLSAGLYAACFEISGFWYDLARVDSLFLCFFIIGFYFMRFYRSNPGLLLSGIFLAMSFLTKQSAIFFVIPLAIFSILDRKWSSLYFILSCLFISAGVSYYFNIQSAGWYYYWLFELPAGHDWVYSKVISFWTSDIFNPLAFAFILTLSYFFFQMPKNMKILKIFKSGNYTLYFFTIIGLFACSYLSRIHSGGYDNVLMPAFLIITILFGMGIKEFEVVTNKFQDSKNQYLKFILFGAIISQFLVMFYNPVKQIPNVEDIEYGNQFITTIKNISGEILIPNHPSYSIKAGKKTFAHYYVLNDFFSSNSGFKVQLNSEFNNALKNKKFSAIILDHPLESKEIKNFYRLEKILFKEKDFFNCKTGGCKLRPEYLYRPIQKIE